jgi:diacylglycerol kinase (ATP)
MSAVRAAPPPEREEQLMTSHIAVVWNPSKTEKETLESGLTEAIGEGATPEITWWETTKEDPGQGAAKDALAART